MLDRVAICLLFVGARGWATRSQTNYGAQISQIQAQMRGGPYTRHRGSPAGVYSCTPSTEKNSADSSKCGQSQAELGYLWTMPSDVSNTAGLGGGITWAWNPTLCDDLRPRFREDIFGWPSFLNCDDYKSAVARAFDKWSANNRWIKFLDVTRECEMAGLAYEGQNQSSALPGKPFMPHGGCQLAEIWVTKYVPSTSGRRLSEEMPTPTHRSRAESLEPVSHNIMHAHSRSLDGDSVSDTVTAYYAPPSAHHRRSLQGVSGTVAEMGGGGTAVATAQAHAKWSSDFRYTNGETPYVTVNGQPQARSVVETYAGTFSFNADQVCWYMDGEFCSVFHRFKVSMGGAANARLFVDGMTYGLMAVGIFFYLIFFVTIALRVSGMACDGSQREDDEDGDGVLTIQERLNAGVRAVSHFNPLTLTIFISLLVIPPLVENKIFKPCFECFDFEAAALHEIGHFLGLGHLDNIPQNWQAPAACGGVGSRAFACDTPGNNSYQSQIALAVEHRRRPDNFTCADPWAEVHPGTPPGAVLDSSQTMGYGYRNAQMEARTQHNPLACLTDDDLEALATLYPDCSVYALSGSSCHKVQMNIGYVRLTVYVLFPMLLALLMVVCCSTIIHEFEKRERRRDAEAAKAFQDAVGPSKAVKTSSIQYQIEQKKHHNAVRRKSTSAPPVAYPAVTSTDSEQEMARRA